MTTEPETIQVQFQPVGKRLSLPAGASVLDGVRQAGIELATACGGEGSCGQCRVVVLSGQSSSPTGDEEFILSEVERRKGIRLACCTHLLGDAVISIPKESLITGPRLQVESSLAQIAPEPGVRSYPLELAPPSLSDPRCDLSRIEDALSGLAEPGLTASLPVIRDLPVHLRQAGWKVTAFVRGRELAGIAAGQARALGLAVDLGTTKIAARLVDLEAGHDLAVCGAPNPQMGYGDDVISRIQYASRSPQGGQVLAEKVRATLNEILGDLLAQAGQARRQVVEACIVGNTAMTHLLLGFPVRQLASAPYVAAASRALDVPAAELGLEMAPGALVHIPPGVGGFVGADHIAMVLASDLDGAGRVALGIDIGTNTEISLRVPGRPYLTAASCASGPAFEGAHIRDGMRAASGAIEKVRLGPAGPELVTIDDAPAVGLCGSGILDAVAELYRTGLLDKWGHFQNGRSHPAGLRAGSQGAEFVLAPAERSGTGREILLTQNDVREIQLAKGAIQAGLNILIESSGLKPEMVEEVIVAGAFGSFLNIHNALAIGLFPHLPNARYRQVGNAAPLGAKWILISQPARRRAAQIARSTRYFELTTYPRFNRQFALAMLFPGDEHPSGSKNREESL